MLLLVVTILAALIGELLSPIGRYEERLYPYWTWPDFLPLCPNVSAGPRMLGAGTRVTAAGLAATMAGVAIAVWYVFRRGASPLAVALLMAGTFLATPYAVFYDLSLLSYALVLVAADRRSGPDGFSSAEVAVLILGVALPLLLRLDVLRVPWGLVVPGAVFLLILRRIAGQTDARAPG